jgi:tRNA nucleotidyltransferase (CCA-adding enzyme)
VLQPRELDDLGFTAADRDAIAEATTAHDLALRLCNARTGSEIARTVGTSRIETVALAFSQGAPSQSKTWLEHLRHLTLEITGDDLIANGIPQGPRLGQALQSARDALMDGEARDRESQLTVALQAAE